MELGRIGVWWSGSWQVPAHRDLEIGPELERLGYGTIWSSGGFKAGLSSRFGRLLDVTERLVVASGIVNIWLTPAQKLAADVDALERRHPGRFLLGLGASHAALVPDYHRPQTHVAEYLDQLDTLGESVSSSRRILAALRPRMLNLARDRSLGAHPYFVPVAHTARARDVLGDGPILAPEVAVVVDDDPDRALDSARQYAATYLGLENYVNNLLTLGFSEEDVSGGGSTRLLEAVVPWGDAERVALRLREHLDAGADHICVQVVGTPEGFPLGEYRSLAAALGL